MLCKRFFVLSFLVCLVACSQENAPSQDSFDVLIINGMVYDGSLSGPVPRSIGIKADRIVSMQAADDAPAEQVIDATGLVVVPGFIDPHTHALADLLDAARADNANYLAQGVSTVFVGNDGGGIPQREAGVASMRAHGTGTNVAFFSGHNDIRESVLGLENRAPTQGELEDMQNRVDADMRAGALGLSTGLFYKPGSYATTEEVIALAQTAASYGGVYDSHMRDESTYSIGLLGAVDEVIRIAEAANIPAHIAHLKALGLDVWGQSGDIIARVDAARASGLQVTADQYPYRASGTRFGSALIPRWVMANSREAMFARLANPDLEERIRTEMEENIRRRGGIDAMLVTGDSDFRGMTLEEIAAQLNLPAYAAAIEVVRSGDPSIASFNMNPDDISAIAIQPWVMTGSDGSAGHPRKYGTYPQAYRDFVVTNRIMTIEQFVHRSTGLVADTFFLCDRGYLREGRKADLALLDLDDFKPVANFEQPELLASGVTYMLVNGVLVIDAGTLSDARPGQVIDRQNLDCQP